MCMWFGINWISFCHFFHFVNLVIFWPQILWMCIDSGYLVSATLQTILYQSFLNFTQVFSMDWRYAYGLDIILELIFVTFSTLWNLSFSDLRFYENLSTVASLWAQPFTQFHTNLYATLHNLFHWFEDVFVNPAVNICHFINFVTFQFFCRGDINFTEVRSIFWTYYSMVEPHCSNFRIITASFRVCKFFFLFLWQ